MESLRILESGNRHALVQHHLARRTTLFLCHFFHERCQRHNLFDSPTFSESSKFNVKMILFFENYCYLMLLFPRPTLVLEVVLSCRLVLNLRSTAGEISALKPNPGVLPWSNNSNNSQYRTYTYPSSSIIIGNQSRSSDIQGTSTLGREMKLEPNRARPESIWNAETLYTTF